MTHLLDYYIITSIAEYFDMITHFRQMFSFISPNIINIFLVIIAIIAAKLITLKMLYNMYFPNP